MNDDTARDLVLEAADQLYYARGIQAVGMDELRAHAGVSLKKVYSLFPSKEAIVEQMLGRRNAQWTHGIVATAEQHDDPRAKLLSIFDFLAWQFAAGDFRGCAFINSFGELGASAPAVAEAARAHKAQFQEYVAALVDEAGAPPILAFQLVLLAEGAQTTAAILENPDVAAQARAAAAVLIDSALAR
ncbi:TetR/AcrR family transcriptional regulator [soil metagenome]